MRPPFFIVGTQRSGTTLLGQMLDSHPGLYVLNEFWDVYPHLTGEVDDPAALEALLISFLRLPRAYVTEGQPGPETPFDHLDRAMVAAARVAGKLRWGIKDPSITYHLEAIRRGFADARFIFIVRDARGVCNSYLDVSWHVANALHGARLWRTEIEAQRAFQARHAVCCHVLRFEDLIAEPESELRRVCEFLEERFDRSMLAFYRHPPRTELHAGNINVTRPIRTEVADKWLTGLSARQIDVVESQTADLLLDYGYELRGQGSGPGWAERKMLELHQAVVAAYRWRRQSGWRGVRRRLGRLFGRR